MTKTKNKNNIFQFIIALAAGCLVFAVMQGIHDNYGIMLPGIVARSGLDYASVSFVIAVCSYYFLVTGYLSLPYSSLSFSLSAFSATIRWSMQSWMSPSMKAARL